MIQLQRWTKQRKHSDGQDCIVRYGRNQQPVAVAEQHVRNPKTQIPLTEVNRLELLTEPNQGIKSHLAGPIKSKARGDVKILVAIDRFSKWPTARICKNIGHTEGVETVNEISHNWTPRTIRNDNRSCFKSKEFKEFCNGENIKRTGCTPNLHIVKRTIRTIKSLTRATLGTD